MRKVLMIILMILSVFTVTGCDSSPFSFRQSVEEVESIEIVSAESSLQFTSIKLLSDEEKKEFLEQLQLIEFVKYIGDPPKLSGDAIKINYRDGAYEMICAYTVEYVEEGKIQYRWRSCSEKDFVSIFNKFSEQ
ncbi:MAG: hypothetical protein IJB96_08395 [Lachnospira sp.]|nr:hypothetical protein [Lachnospira sp.]